MKRNVVVDYRKLTGYLGKTITCNEKTKQIKVFTYLFFRRSDSALTDGQDNNISLSEGYFDAG